MFRPGHSALGQLDAALVSAPEAIVPARTAQARLALAFALHQLAETKLERAVDTAIGRRRQIVSRGRRLLPCDR